MAALQALHFVHHSPVLGPHWRFHWHRGHHWEAWRAPSLCCHPDSVSGSCLLCRIEAYQSLAASSSFLYVLLWCNPCVFRRGQVGVQEISGWFQPNSTSTGGSLHISHSFPFGKTTIYNHQAPGNSFYKINGRFTTLDTAALPHQVCECLGPTNLVHHSMSFLPPGFPSCRTT